MQTYTPDLDPMLGRTIRDFRIEKKLAQGGMGAVYLGRHVLLANTLKVIKVLLPAYAAEPELRQRFHREAEAASKLKHDCILGIDNFGTLDDGQLFIVVPYLEGQPLDSYLRSRGSLVPHRALHLVAQLCDALDHAHSLGVIHRDLKPANVFLTATSTNPYALKLLDFGIAKLADKDDPQTHSGIPLGTPSYMAVEQYQHADRATHLADIYSLAIVVWEMVTGRLPWRHADHALLYHQQRTVIPERPPESEMPSQWADLLLSALSVDPASRPQSAREFAFGLASPLPAVERFPSGAEILAGLVPHFMRNAAPTYETVRNLSDVDRIGPLLWPPRETASVSLREPPRLSHHTASDSETAPTHALAMRHAANGRTRARKLTLAAIGTAAVAAVMAGIAATVSLGDVSDSKPASVLSFPPNNGTSRATAPAVKDQEPAPGTEAASAEPSRALSPSSTPATDARSGNQRVGPPDVRTPLSMEPALPQRRSRVPPSGVPKSARPTITDPDDVYEPEK